VLSQDSRQLKGIDEHLVCDVCGRTMLKGERPEHYLAPSRERKLVCSLCATRAQKEGWIREAANPDTPVQPPRPSDRRRIWRRRRARPDEPVAPAAENGVGLPPEPQPGDGPAGDGEQRRGLLGERATRPRAPRQVRAVPTNAQLKIERAVELFNDSEHRRTVAGIARALGAPHVSACTSGVSAARVLLTVAWELSWYQFAIDLSDAREPVRLHGRGHELDELPSKVRRWNAHAAEDGRIEIEAVESSNGEPAEEGL
jgi:hypothetical protein